MARRDRKSAGRKAPGSGDSGETCLPGIGSVSKASIRIAALGELDELSAAIGFAAVSADKDTKAVLEQIQADLFCIGADVAAPRRKRALLDPERVTALELLMGRYEAAVQPTAHFLLPGGSESGARLHLARAISRRAERSVAALTRGRTASPCLAYLNRVSDLLFSMARAANAKARVAQKKWTPRGK